MKDLKEDDGKRLRPQGPAEPRGKPTDDGRGMGWRGKKGQAWRRRGRKVKYQAKRLDYTE